MADAVTTVDPGGALRGRYVLRERLGKGGHAEVWRAHDPHRAADIALKILQPGAARVAQVWTGLLREHEFAGLLNHPCILKLYTPERHDTMLLLPMELASGGDLRQLRGADYLVTMPLLIEVAQALEHAHARGVVHRDLKPGNVLLDAHGHVKVADFGLAARILAAGDPRAPRGWSPFSASPAQLRGDPPACGDDVYGLGALAYELLSRYPPHYPYFQAQRLQQEPVPPLVPAAPVPPALQRLITRMLAKDPARRPTSMREIVDELDRGLNDTLTFNFEGQGGGVAAPVRARPRAAAPGTPADGFDPEMLLDADVPTVLPAEAIEALVAAPAIQPAVSPPTDAPVPLLTPAVWPAADAARRVRTAAVRARSVAIGLAVAVLVAIAAVVVLPGAWRRGDLRAWLSSPVRAARGSAALAAAVPRPTPTLQQRQSVGQAVPQPSEAPRTSADTDSPAHAPRPSRAVKAESPPHVRRADSRNLAQLQSQGQALEAQERWRAALALYKSVPGGSAAPRFAREGRRRSSARLRLDEALQSQLAHPERLGGPQARAQAAAVLELASRQAAPGPVLRAQIAQLTALLAQGR